MLFRDVTHHVTGQNVVETFEELHDGRLAAAARAAHGDELAPTCFQGHAS